MGVVYKAEDTKLKRLVALKFLPKEVASDPEIKARFLREAKTAASLQHPNIATIYSIEEFKGRYFIAMEYIEGKTLKQIIREGRLALNQIMDIAIQVAKGLKAAHNRGIIHRDIKSDNIMIAKDNQVKIMDFGLAKAKGMAGVTKPGTTLGTVSYMSPEQVQGMEIDERSDIFSFGVVIYELLTGKLPFQGEREPAILYSIVNEEPAPVSELRPDIPESLERIVNKILQKEPEDRYKTLDEILGDLERVRFGKKHRREKRRALWKVSIPLAGVGVLLILWLKGIILNPRTTEKSIAVLYFENLNEGKEDDYFCNGITEDIIVDLSKIRTLRVCPRSQVLRYKNQSVDISALSKALRVTHILEGSVRREGDRVRVSAQLIDAKKGYTLWAERFDRKIEDIFDIQAQLAHRITQALRIELTPEEERRIAKKPTPNLNAYDYILKGREYMHRFTKEDMGYAIKMFEKALRLDNRCAPAYAWLGQVYAHIYNKGWTQDLSYLERSIEYAEKALSIDKENWEAHWTLGLVYSMRGMYKESIKEYERAITIAPPSADLWNDLGIAYARVGRYKDAISAYEHSIEVDPINPIVYNNLGWTYFAMGKIKKAIVMNKKAIDLQPDFVLPYRNLGIIYLSQKEYKKGLSWLKKALKIDPESFYGYWYLGVTYYLMGKKKDAIPMFERAAEIAHTPETLYDLGIIYQLSGKKKEANRTYNRVIEMGSKSPEDLKTHLLLSLAYFHKGMKGKADKYMEKVLESGPEDPSCCYRIASLFSLKGERVTAMEWLKKAFNKSRPMERLELLYRSKLDPDLENIRELISKGGVWEEK